MVLGHSGCVVSELFKVEEWDWCECPLYPGDR